MSSGIPSQITIKHPDGTQEVLVVYTTQWPVILIRLLLVVLEWLEAIHAKQP